MERKEDEQLWAESGGSENSQQRTEMRNHSELHPHPQLLLFFMAPPRRYGRSTDICWHPAPRPRRLSRLTPGPIRPA